jgi:hypothetical protein
MILRNLHHTKLSKQAPTHPKTAPHFGVEQNGGTMPEIEKPLYNVDNKQAHKTKLERNLKATNNIQI